ncbi:LexA family protein [Streptomyces sp. NPDC048172]|uniref:LexA family protein n=1 Tax=Streptomyces sp. NPDC048172 TaxID=3365505 RepID=UPI00371A5250
MSELSGQQERILRAARGFVAERGVHPTMRELADAVGLSSTSTVAYHLRRMREVGPVVETRGRSLRPCPLCGAEALPAEDHFERAGPASTEEE